jgi:hypothetical protein
MNITTLFSPFSILAFSGLRLVGLKICYAGSDVASWYSWCCYDHSIIAVLTHGFNVLSLLFLEWFSFLYILLLAFSRYTKHQTLPVLISCLLLTTPFV